MRHFLITHTGTELTASGLMYASSNPGTKLHEDKNKAFDLI